MFVMPLMAISLLANCGGGDTPTGSFTIDAQCSYCYFDSIQESYKGGSNVDLSLRLYDGEYTLPSNPEIYFGEKLAVKDTDYTYTVNGLTANLKFKINSNVKIIASVVELEEPLTFTATTNNSSLSLYLTCYGTAKTNLDLEAKVNNREWAAVTTPTQSGTSSTIVDNLNTGDRVQLRGNNDFWSYDYEDPYEYRTLMFVTNENDRFIVSGNIMSLLDKEEFVNKKDVSSYEFEYLFAIENYGIDNYCQIIDASKLCLSATNLSDYCYDGLFAGTLIAKAPYLPATTLARGCYNSMFSSCNNLTIAPKLMATEIAPLAYAYIFYCCYNLIQVEVSFTATSTSDWPYDKDSPFGKQSTYRWICINETPQAGTFIWPGETDQSVLEAAGLLSQPEGGYRTINYIPAGWTIKNK